MIEPMGRYSCNAGLTGALASRAVMDRFDYTSFRSVGQREVIDILRNAKPICGRPRVSTISSARTGQTGDKSHWDSRRQRACTKQRESGSALFEIHISLPIARGEVGSHSG